MHIREIEELMAAVPIQCIWFDLIEKQNILTITLTKKLNFFLHVVINPVETLVYLQCLKPSYVMRDQCITVTTLDLLSFYSSDI